MSGLMDEDVYERLRQYVGIDVLNIEGGFITTPMVLLQAGELASKALGIRDRAKQQLELAEAHAAQAIRSVPVQGKEPSQNRIDSMVPLDDDVQTAKTAYNQAAEHARTWENLHDSLKTQSMLMHKVADLTTTGYFNPKVLNDKAREAIRQAKIEAERQKVRGERPGTPPFRPEGGPRIVRPR